MSPSDHVELDVGYLGGNVGNYFTVQVTSRTDPSVQRRIHLGAYRNGGGLGPIICGLDRFARDENGRTRYGFSCGGGVTVQSAYPCPDCVTALAGRPGRVSRGTYADLFGGPHKLVRLAAKPTATQLLDEARRERDEMAAEVNDLTADWDQEHALRTAAESAHAEMTRLAQHLAEDAQKRRCELTAFPAEGDMHEARRADRGRCKGDVIGVRWEDGWADWVCDRHAASAEDRGVLVVRPQRHDGVLPAPTSPERSER